MDKQTCFDCGASWHPFMRRSDHLETCRRRRACPGCGLFPDVKTGVDRHYAKCPNLRTFARLATPEQQRNAERTCEHCDEPEHTGHCSDAFRCPCDEQICEDARRRALAIPGISPKGEEN